MTWIDCVQLGTNLTLIVILAGNIRASHRARTIDARLDAIESFLRIAKRPP